MAAANYEYTVYPDSADEWRWRLTRGKKVLADSGEGYKTRAGAKNAVVKLQEASGKRSLLGSAAIVLEDKPKAVSVGHGK